MGLIKTDLLHKSLFQCMVDEECPGCDDVNGDTRGHIFIESLGDLHQRMLGNQGFSKVAKACENRSFMNIETCPLCTSVPAKIMFMLH